MIDDILLFAVVGFVAQMVDGAIGMAYGLSASAVLMSLGTPPAMASASVHAAEIFTTGASGFAHWRVGNVDWRLMARLAVPGVAGGILGAYILVDLPVDYVKPAVAAYLLVMGGVILFKALRPRPQAVKPHNTTVLGFCGGFLDAIGGGGWGPLVASTLIGRGNVPRISIGSTNAAEFFVTSAITVTFLGTIGLELLPVIIGLVIGGIIAAPFAALITKRLPDRPMMIMVAVVIMLLSLRNLLIAVGVA